MKHIICFWVCLFLSSCAKVPDGITPVHNFEPQRYGGTWYEIARLDHSFERGMTHVTASYTLKEDGQIGVVNQGYHPEKQVWKKAKASAYLAGALGEGFLRVSFFWPFYGSYVIFGLDHKKYDYAFVTGGPGYLWLLSRTPHVSDDVRRLFLKESKSLGFSVKDLIWVKQTGRPLAASGGSGF